MKNELSSAVAGAGSAAVLKAPHARSSGGQRTPAPGSAPVRALQRQLVDLASARYRDKGRFAYHFSRGKLGGDPMFIELLRLGAFTGQRGRGARFLDLGCGQAVFASWLVAARTLAEQGRWPSDWPEPPRIESVRALELMPADVARGQAGFADEPRVHVEQGDICEADFGNVDVITILDVIHYLPLAAQDDVLCRIRAALRPGGVLVMRVGDAAGGWPYRLSRWADQAITLGRGHGWAYLHCRPLATWTASLHALGFQVHAVPTPGGLPFANVLLIAHVPAEGAA
ncbi:class I SAM-dependent methyltransferase [Ottowia sp. GY511]|uniref:Methyltransferase domain-containing protein n=1 Tax=Ottowia flava TaxID=2675430 RepID=A0ABW4KSL3_9BURK|nr:class I SAM-dependent methyltransferase [Ottowia sp. GY511]TXK29520.1 class I SAM-dependent methyltransferase [Ottowia sp. GY511]